MRLASHLLKKNPSSHKKQVKHTPKKLNKIVRKQEKLEKKSAMTVDEETAGDMDAEVMEPSETEKAQQVIAKHNAKMARKKQTAASKMYKKIDTSMSTKHGPRAVTK
jgi:hypothetical protein